MYIEPLLLLLYIYTYINYFIDLVSYNTNINNSNNYIKCIKCIKCINNSNNY